MSQFSSLATVTRSAEDIVRITILNARFNFLEALEKYMQVSERGLNVDLSVSKARLVTLWLEIRSTYYDKRGVDKGAVLHAKVFSINSKDDLVNVYCVIDSFLYEIKLTFIASKTVYDTFLPEAENSAKHL